MESMIDFLRFRLCEREDFIALSTVDVQGRFQAAMLSPRAASVNRFLKQFLLVSLRCRAAPPPHIAVRLCLYFGSGA